MRFAPRAVLLVLAGCLLLAPAAAADRKVPRGFFGINYAGEIENAPPSVQRVQWDRLARAGVESARMVFNWDLAEKKRGTIEWYRMDNAVRFSARRRIQLLPTVLYVPPWARRYGDQPASPPEKTSYYTGFLRKLIRRYGPDGKFWSQNKDIPKRPLRIWQIMNEIDLQFQWYRPENRWRKKHAAEYGRLLKASYRAVKDEDPKAKVMLAALAIDSWRILDELYDRAEIEGYFDIAAFQPQAGKASFLPTVARRFRGTLNDHGDSKIPIWGTEMAQPASLNRSPPLGYATGYMDGYATTDAGMAAHLKAGYNALAKKSFRKEVKLKRVMWFTGVSPYSGDFEYDYSGLLWQHGGTIEPKPAYNAYRTVARNWEGCEKKANGDCK